MGLGHRRKVRNLATKGERPFNLFLLSQKVAFRVNFCDVRLLFHGDWPIPACRGGKKRVIACKLVDSRWSLVVS